MFLLSIGFVCLSLVVGFPSPQIDIDYPHIIQTDDESLYLYLPQVWKLINYIGDTASHSQEETKIAGRSGIAENFAQQAEEEGTDAVEEEEGVEEDGTERAEEDGAEAIEEDGTEGGDEDGTEEGEHVTMLVMPVMLNG